MNTTPGQLDRGNLIAGNTGVGISLGDLSTQNVVLGNFIGTDPSGTAALPNGDDGIDIHATSTNNTIGGTNTTPGQLNVGNLISGNTGYGVEVNGTGNVLRGNFIGTDPAGTVALPNTLSSVNVVGSGNTIGGPNSVAGVLDGGNLISGNTGDGILLNSSSGNRVQGNFIGTDPSGTLDLGNGGAGVSADGSNNTIGGAAGLDGNRFAFNSIGALVDTGTGNSILSNAFLGDDHDQISYLNGANNNQAAPVPTQAILVDSDTVYVEGTLSSVPSEDFMLQVFASGGAIVGDRAEIYLGSATISTDGSGTASFRSVVDFNASGIAVGMAITVTATRVSNGDSSDLSATATELIPLSTVVTNTHDDGDGSLRKALFLANIASGAQTITFDLPGTGPDTIRPLSALPEITDTIVIDGSTEPDFASTPIIVLDGSMAGSDVDGLRLGAGSDGSTVRGLVIQRFSGDGIEISSAGNQIVGNFIGTDAAGTADLGNTLAGIAVNGANNTIGGPTAADRNVISGNDGPGLGLAASGNVVQGNAIGTDASGGSTWAMALRGSRSTTRAPRPSAARMPARGIRSPSTAAPASRSSGSTRARQHDPGQFDRLQRRPRHRPRRRRGHRQRRP